MKILLLLLLFSLNVFANVSNPTVLLTNGTISGTTAIGGTLNFGSDAIFASGNGPDFTATSNSSGTVTAEKLTDIEYGTWLPEVSATGINTTSATYTTQSGTYIKINNLVIAKATVAWNAWTLATGNMVVIKWPFAVQATAPCFFRQDGIAITTANVMEVYITNSAINQAAITQYSVATGAESAVAVDTNVAALHLTCIYTTIL